ncbi:hypothetical protein H6P81_009609 [Aristolochia fimbriata]|uniref:Uncharacterized protein n=1 Tax=Aristolochia fimbriata TaxID=158543 RepID=A0AAV7ELY6_ARIFI|nr:hypothetical protein H6P81_009609 [Aristolochia fimbriata]
MANPGDGTVFLNRTTRATRGKRNRARIEERRRRRRRRRIRVVGALFRPSLLEIAQHIPSRVAGDASMGVVPWLPRTSPLKGSSIDINLVEIMGRSNPPTKLRISLSAGTISAVSNWAEKRRCGSASTVMVFSGRHHRQHSSSSPVVVAEPGGYPHEIDPRYGVETSTRTSPRRRGSWSPRYVDRPGRDEEEATVVAHPRSSLLP